MSSRHLGNDRTYEITTCSQRVTLAKLSDSAKLFVCKDLASLHAADEISTLHINGTLQDLKVEEPFRRWLLLDTKTWFILCTP